MGGKVIHNLEQLAEGIGSYIGMMEGLNQQTYMDSLLERTYVDVSGSFNKAAAAAAMRNPEEFAHMWEFGTAGITRGRTKYANPTNPNAMLWQNVMTGTGKTKNIAFVFKPAKSFTPPHTTESTGVEDQKVLDRLKVNTGERKYRFPNKAFVFESGTDIKVMAKRSKRLFIPIATEGLPNGAKDTGKGYVWAKTHTYSPGDYSGGTGQFTAFFGGWWLGPGATLMFDAMSRQVEMDLISVEKTVKPSRRMTAAQAANIKAAAKRGQTKTRKQFTLKVRQEMNKKADVLL